MDFDVLIIGGGLVGASLAAALKPSRLSVALLEDHPPDSGQMEGWDSRIYAISPGSADFLAECGALHRLDRARVQPVEGMRVFGDDGAELDFSAYQLGVPELAFILEGRQLSRALWQTLRTQENLELFYPVRCSGITWSPNAACVQLEDGREITARLVVGADGQNSWTRHQAGLNSHPSPYGQSAVVANFSAALPHRGIACQWFQPDGILALLPLPQQQVSMVWSVSTERAAAMLQLPQGELGGLVTALSFGVTGNLELTTAPATFPLHRMKLPATIRPRLALIGDAAHIVHPLAGQGVNLGFRDARCLARVLLECEPWQDCGSLQLLRRHERARQEDVTAMLFATDALQRLFNNSNPVLRRFRNAGLAAAGRMRPLKNMLARYALH